MADPLAEVVSLLQPNALHSKIVSGSGAWAVHRSEAGTPFYCILLEGGSRLIVGSQEPVELQGGDFVLIPAAQKFRMESLQGAGRATVDPLTVTELDGEIRHGDPEDRVNARLLVGHFEFASPDAALLVSLLPHLIWIRGERRLVTLVQLVGEEARNLRPGRDLILTRLLEVMLVEALRSTAGTAASPGLLRGLADSRLASAIRRMHEDPTKDWSVEGLAREASLSRSAFFDRFRRTLGMAPMEYLLSWRMALAKNLLCQTDLGIKEVAERVGYGSASAFSVAFTRFVGLPPTRYPAQDAPGQTG